MTAKAFSAPGSHPAERPLRIVLAAGGTGGHLMPALATAEALATHRTCEFLVIGSPRASERELRSLVPYPTVEIRARALAGSGIAGKIRGLLRLGPAVVRAWRELRKFDADLVVATGGYVCGPTGIAARLAGTPLLVLEQNAAPGLTTRGLRPLAAAIGVSFEETATRLGPKAILTGNPVRSTLSRAEHRDGVPRPRARDGVHLLILGGSQGARGLNTMVADALGRIAGADIGITVTHQAGPHDIEELRQSYAHHGIPATVLPFITEMGQAYARASLVCGRAGATTAAELTYCGLPSILVPYPHAAGKHQHANARALERLGATIPIEESTDGTALAEAIIALASSPARLAEMAAASAQAGRDDAAEEVARLALRIMNGHAGASRTAIDRGGAHHTAPRTTETP
jgi:UDP-N-acetylglucosamine--N-acetylmuramyl-(pentapeptide) pyrophosphoryl-undecaprenol N-acetylglucosamine transferase